MKFTEHKQFRCSHPGCDKVFNRRDYLERHATNHLSVKPFVCVQCDRHFSRKDLYDNHLTTKRHARVVQEVGAKSSEHSHQPLSATAGLGDSQASGAPDALEGKSVGASGTSRASETSEALASDAGPASASRYSFGSLNSASPRSAAANSMHIPPGYFVPLDSRSQSLPFLHSAHASASLYPYQGYSSRAAQDAPDASAAAPGDMLAMKSRLGDYPAPQGSISPRALSLPFSYGGAGAPFSMNASMDGMSSPHGNGGGSMRQSHSQSFSGSNTMLSRDTPETAHLDPLGGPPWYAGSTGAGASASLRSTPQFATYGVGTPTISSDRTSSGFGSSGYSDSRMSDSRSSRMSSGSQLGLGAGSTHHISSSKLAALVDERVRGDMTRNPDPFPGLRRAPEMDDDDEENEHAVVATNESGGETTNAAAMSSNSGATNKTMNGTNGGVGVSKTTAGSRTPAEAVISICGEERYAWFFDDKFVTDSAKLGYDRCYSLANDQYTDRAAHLPPPKRVLLGSQGSISGPSPATTKISLDSSSGVPDSMSRRPDVVSASSSPITGSVLPVGGSSTSPIVASSAVSHDALNDAPKDARTKNTSLWPLPHSRLSPERARQVMAVLGDLPEITSLSVVEDWILAAWRGADAVKHIVHAATFDGNEVHLSLLAVLALVGMALSEDHAVAACARRCHAAVFLYAYEALEKVPSATSLSSGRLDLPTVNILQAFGLLLRYDRLVLIGDSNHVQNARNISGQYVTDLYLGKVLAAVPHIGEFPDAGSGNSSAQIEAYGSSFGGSGNANGGGIGSSVSGVSGAGSGNSSRISKQKQHPSNAKVSMNIMDPARAPPNSLSSPSKQPIWATLTSEAYMFHQGADPESQWYEWALIECVKRTAHLSLYLDSIVSLSKTKPSPVLISNMDIHMVCPDALWQAPSAAHFLEIAGPSRTVANVPYLGLIKSLIRFPRVAQSDESLETARQPWSIFALKAVAHGLIILVGKMSGLIPYGDQMLQAVMQSRSNPSSLGSGEIFPKFDRQLQARLYRGLDVWHHYFTAAYGDVMERIMRLTGSKSVQVSDSFDPPPEDSDDMPQYALVIVLCHYSSFIYVHEDLPVVLQVTSNLKQWLETNKSRSLQMLLDYLYMPLYTNWIRTPEAKGMVSAASLYLAWTHAVTGQAFIGNHLFLSVMIYIAVIVVWLYDFASAAGRGEAVENYSPLRLDDFAFMEDAIDYIHTLHKNLNESGPPPEKRAITSLIMLAACLLYKRKSTEPLVNMLIQLLSVMDVDHSKKELMTVVRKSRGLYDERVAAVNEAASTRRFSSPEEAVKSDKSKAVSDEVIEPELDLSDDHNVKIENDLSESLDSDLGDGLKDEATVQVDAMIAGDDDMVSDIDDNLMEQVDAVVDQPILG